ncbi:hypothetical protein B0H19DRAFT_1069861 [Mycena capillaripes]|nr:hypothetical protein B0H19DRAFT_1069861 [Mycena capillaripes]
MTALWAVAVCRLGDGGVALAFLHAAASGVEECERDGMSERPLKSGQTDKSMQISPTHPPFIMFRTTAFAGCTRPLCPIRPPYDPPKCSLTVQTDLGYDVRGCPYYAMSRERSRVDLPRFLWVGKFEAIIRVFAVNHHKNDGSSKVLTGKTFKRSTGSRIIPTSNVDLRPAWYFY